MWQPPPTFDVCQMLHWLYLQSLEMPPFPLKYKGWQADTPGLGPGMPHEDGKRTYSNKEMIIETELSKALKLAAQKYKCPWAQA